MEATDKQFGAVQRKVTWLARHNQVYKSNTIFPLGAGMRILFLKLQRATLLTSRQHRGTAPTP